MELSSTAHVILGMLRKGPKSGYDIKAKADVSTRFFWAISYGQIYPELKRLERAGLIAGEDDSAGGGRRRRVYSITAEGERALREWLTAGGELHVELRHEGLLRFFFGDALDTEERLGLVRAMRARHERLGAELRALRPTVAAYAEESGDDSSLLTLEAGIAYQRSMTAICDRLERRLTEQGSTATGRS